MPLRTPKLPGNFFRNLTKYSFNEIALKVSRNFIAEISRKELGKIVRKAFNFAIPLRKLDDNLYILELFHGPTMAFKDFGARFLARTLGYFLKTNKQKLSIIVATSGDTGSAVASGFYQVPNIKVFILYPSKKVSPLQEKQLTTFGANIVAIEVLGRFDDCQKLAKAVLNDQDLKQKYAASSANSINFGRLLPQSFYYFWAVRQLRLLGIKKPPVFVVPSGNFGNLTSGLLAKKMGLPVHKFIAATNVNKIIPRYLKTGKFSPKKSKQTISNAMDVGNPSNFARMLALYEHDHLLMQKDIEGVSITDNETRRTIKEIFKKTGYIMDPHTAVGVAASKRIGYDTRPVIVLGTAHPAKFMEIVEPVIGKKIGIPTQLKSPFRKKKKSIIMKNDVEALKTILSDAAFRRN